MKRHLTFIACLAVTSLVQAAPAIASTDEPDYEVMATGLLSPLHLAVDKDESVFVSQSFAGILTHVEDDGDRDDVYTTAKEGWSVAGVDIHDHTAYFLEGFGAGQGMPDELRGYLKALEQDGEVRTIADIAEYERKFNPDADRHYGFEPGTGQQCLAEAASLPDAPPAQYMGAVDSNPYAVAVRDETAYVADAGMNAIIKVDLESGEISTVAVLPPRPLTITHKIAESLGVPSCAGYTYVFEPVPTDVEIGPDGWLYVSSLPGGPEDPSLGARGAIFKVNPWTGATVLWQNELVSPTGLAVTDEGDVYVASLFGGEIVKFSCLGERSHFLKVNQPAGVEFMDGDIFATIDALPPQPDPATPEAPMPTPDGKLIEVDFD